MDDQDNRLKNAIIRKHDSETIGWLTEEQVQHIKTIRLISNRFHWTGLLMTDVSKLYLGPNNTVGTIKFTVDIPGLTKPDGFVTLQVHVTVHTLKDKSRRPIEVQIREY